MAWYQSSDLNYVLHWLILFCLTEFPDTTSITDLVENDTIKSLARSSIAYSACSSFAALSGNSTDQKTAEHREPMEHLLKVRQATVINISDHVCTGMIYYWGLLYG